MAEEAGWERLTPAQQQFVAMNAVEGQITNGGFHAIYYNNCAAYLQLAMEGYETIGAKPQAELVRTVLAMMSEDRWAGPPETWPDPKAESPPSGSKDIGVLDEPWYALDLQALSSLKANFIEAHPETFPSRSK